MRAVELGIGVAIVSNLVAEIPVRDERVVRISINWAGSASGPLSLALENGSLSHKLDAKLGLNGGKLLRSFFSGDKQVPIRCGQVAVDFSRGTGTSRQLLLDTEQTRIDGAGSLHLGDESWAVLLTPSPHGAAPLALKASVLAKGSFRDLSYALAERADDIKTASKADSGSCTAACSVTTSAASTAACD